MVIFGELFAWHFLVHVEKPHGSSSFSMVCMVWQPWITIKSKWRDKHRQRWAGHFTNETGACCQH